MIDTSALREKVLDLAIRGKLVPQDPNDEPASVLLERIRAEKEQMVKDGKLKAKDIKNDTVIFKGEDNLHYEKFSDGTVKCIEDEIPFDVPDGWAWCRLEIFCPYGDCEKVDTKNIEDTEWILDLEDIEKGTGKIINYVAKAERNSVSTKHRFYQGQLLYSKLRPYLNKVVIAPQNGYCTSEILPLKFYGNISPRYMQLFLMSNTFLSYVNMISYGVKMPRLGTEDGKRALIALPPIGEQGRITDKYDSLKPLILNLKDSCDDMQITISSIKSKILDIAIQGKLVPQNPDDEPASVLLERIKAEKEELIKQGKIKRDKKESVIFKGEDNSYYEKIGDNIVCIDDEIPFEIPAEWRWERLGNISTIARGGSPRPINEYLTNQDNGINWIKIGDTEQGGKYIYSTKEKIIPEGLSKTRYVKSGDFLLTNSMSYGRPYILKTDGCIHDGWLVIADIENIFYQDFLYYALSSNEMYRTFTNLAAGSTVKNLKSDSVKSILFPIPPYDEQLRISNYVEKIYQMIDIIEKSLS